MEWQSLNERTAALKRTFGEAESQVAEYLAAVTQLTKTQNTQSEDLPALRRIEAELAATLQTQRLTLQRIEDEAARLEQTLEEAKAQFTQTETDFVHEQQSLADSTGLLERLEEEHKKIIAEQDGVDSKLEEKNALKEGLEEKVSMLEEEYNALMQSTAEAKAQKDAARQRFENNTARANNLKVRIETVQRDLKEAQDKNKDGARSADLKGAVEALEGKLENLKEQARDNQQALENAEKSVSEARDNLNALENRKSEFDTEISMLQDFLKDDSEGKAPPVLNEVTPDSGFEKALSRALGDSLMASLERDANASWLPVSRAKDKLPALPDGCEVLLPHVKAPKALELALSQIGVVEDDNQGEALLDKLNPGQSLVSRAGSYWRWDGYVVKSSAIDRHSQHLEQKNKLHGLLKQRPQIEGLVENARKSLEIVLKKQEELQKKRAQLSEGIRQTDSDVSVKRSEWSELRETQAKVESEIVRLEQVLQMARDDAGEVAEAVAADKKVLAALEAHSDSDKTERLEHLRESLQGSREALSEAVRAYDLYVQQQSTRKARLNAIGDERVNLQNRSIRSRERIKQLEARKADLSEKLKGLQLQPKDTQNQREQLLSKISDVGSLRDEAAEKLAVCESEVAETTKALKEAERKLSESKEARAHAQATLAAVLEQIEGVENAIAEKFQMKPQDLPEHAAIDMDKDFGDLDSLRQKRESLTRERDQIGPVNLRADDEAQELEKEVTVMIHERNDLLEAIAELRQGINKINAEARERLLGAFEHVNAHFERLFVQLFGGGKAHLALVDTEEVQAKDPLGAGLEIYAQPPGKSLQSLSLLSGGEQTLASIALIFAMFLTNPSPICVLDEIDAPLDDANVDRVCDLLEEIAERGETRFLIITHHRLSMARMDRLYGVTMAEKGVSQLVSVDLQQSFNFLDEAA